MAKKTAKKLQNPFVYQGYKGPDYFCDRLEETEKLISSLRNGRNVTSTFSPLVTNMNWWNCFGEQWWKKPFREEKRLFRKWLMCLWVCVRRSALIR